MDCHRSCGCLTRCLGPFGPVGWCTRPADAVAASADNSHLQPALGDGLSVTEATSTQRVDSKPRNLAVHRAHHPGDTDWLSHRYKSPTALSQGKTDCGTKVYISKLPWSSG